MENLTLKKGPCSFLNLRKGPWEILFPFLLCSSSLSVLSFSWRLSLLCLGRRLFLPASSLGTARDPGGSRRWAAVARAGAGGRRAGAWACRHERAPSSAGAGALQAVGGARACWRERAARLGRARGPERRRRGGERRAAAGTGARRRTAPERGGRRSCGSARALWRLRASRRRAVRLEQRQALRAAARAQHSAGAGRLASGGALVRSAQRSGLGRLRRFGKRWSRARASACAGTRGQTAMTSWVYLPATSCADEQLWHACNTGVHG
jgi:hypothetical protein